MFTFFSFLTSVIAVATINSSGCLVIAGKWDDDTLAGFLDAFDSATRSTPTPRYKKWDRYLANSSLVGLNVACSSREKRCLLRNQLLHADSGSCVRFGDVQRGDSSCRWALDTDALREEMGIHAVCVPLKTRACPWGYRMAYDGRCFDGYRLYTRVCAKTRGLEPGIHASGGVECTCSGGVCDREFEDGDVEGEEESNADLANYEDVEPAEDEDVDDENAVVLRCRVPDLHAPLVPPTEAPVVRDEFSYHFDHSHEREH